MATSEVESGSKWAPLPLDDSFALLLNTYGYSFAVDSGGSNYNSVNPSSLGYNVLSSPFMMSMAGAIYPNSNTANRTGERSYLWGEWASAKSWIDSGGKMSYMATGSANDVYAAMNSNRFVGNSLRIDIYQTDFSY